MVSVVTELHRNALYVCKLVFMNKISVGVYFFLHRKKMRREEERVVEEEGEERMERRGRKREERPTKWAGEKKR